MHARAEAQPKAVEFLLKRGADPNVVSNQGKTAVMWCALQGDTHARIVDMLLKSGAIADHRGQATDTAVYTATERGHLKVVKALLKGGADPNEGAMRGRCAVMEAARTGRADIVDALLKAGAVPDANMNYQILRKTGLDYASGKMPIVDRLGLLSSGLDSSVKDMQEFVEREAKKKRVTSAQYFDTLSADSLMRLGDDSTEDGPSAENMMLGLSACGMLLAAVLFLRDRQRLGRVRRKTEAAAAKQRTKAEAKVGKLRRQGKNKQAKQSEADSRSTGTTTTDGNNQQRPSALQLSTEAGTPAAAGSDQKSAGCTGACTTLTDSCSARQTPYVFSSG